MHYLQYTPPKLTYQVATVEVRVQLRRYCLQPRIDIQNIACEAVWLLWMEHQDALCNMNSLSDVPTFHSLPLYHVSGFTLRVLHARAMDAEVSTMVVNIQDALTGNVVQVRSSNQFLLLYSKMS